MVDRRKKELYLYKDPIDRLAKTIVPKPQQQQQQQVP